MEMTPTQMETKVEQLEADLRRLPSVETSIVELQSQIGDYKALMGQMSQRIEEIFLWLPNCSISPEGETRTPESRGPKDSPQVDPCLPFPENADRATRTPLN